MHKNDEKERIPKTASKELGIELLVEHAGCAAFEFNSGRIVSNK